MKRIFRKSKEDEIFLELLEAKDGIYFFKFPALFKVSLQSARRFVGNYDKYLSFEHGIVAVRTEMRMGLIIDILKMPSLLKEIPEWAVGPSIGIGELYTPKEIRAYKLAPF